MKIKTKQIIRLMIGIFLVHVSGGISYAIWIHAGTPWWDMLVWCPPFCLGLFFILWFTLIEKRNYKNDALGGKSE